MDELILAEVMERLDADDGLPEDVEYLVMAACEGDEELGEALGGNDVMRPQIAPANAQRVVPPGAYLGGITVEGFRGIGATTELELRPGVGLTLVVGRNGSGKSSFAEAAEVLLTGDNERWAARTKVWKEGWRNLHHDGDRHVAATFAVEGHGDVVVIRTWPPEEELITSGAATAQAQGKSRGPLEELGWEAPLKAYRPFLSYNELARMLDEGPSFLYDALASILGLEELVDAHDRLGRQRRTRDKRKKDAVARLRKEIEPLLDASEEQRATDVRSAVEGREPDLDRVEELVTGSGNDDEDALGALHRLANLAPPLSLDDADELARQLRDAAIQAEAIAASAGGRARDTAELLDQALAFHEEHGDGDCPVCGRPGALDAAWRVSSTERLEALRAEARDATAAHHASVNARARLRASLGDPSGFERDAELVEADASSAIAAWQAWIDVDPDGLLVTLAAHVEARAPDLIGAVEAFVAEAARERDRREDAWRPLAATVAGWVEEMKAARAGAEQLPEIRAAEEWLVDTTDEIRAERFAPIAARAKEIWTSLRSESSVDLGRIALAGTATRRRVDVEVNVDGVPGAALGVMSQGELHALALSLFFPRATLDESPFRFVVVDDPVQSMDPVRVDGLARVLEEVARDRQVVVFTHDERLPDAVRNLGVDSTVLEVTRRANSVVEVRQTLDPVSRYIDDARSLLATEELPEETSMRVVPGLCRLALEAAYVLAFRRRHLRGGASHDEVEDAVEAADTANKKAALGLFGDVARTGDVMSALNRFGGWAGTLHKAAQAGTHRMFEGDLRKMVDDTRDLTRKVLEQHG